VILVKFAPDALETPPQELRPNELNLQGRQAARLRQFLNARRGPGQKLFRNFAPADTLGRHRQTGERVRLKDLSRWYRFPVRDTTNVEALAARLQELPLVLKATPDYKASPASIPAEGRSVPPRNEPNDPKFSQQWGFDDFEDHDVDAPSPCSLLRSEPAAIASRIGPIRGPRGFDGDRARACSDGVYRTVARVAARTEARAL
jgi:hypothetical protein